MGKARGSAGILSIVFLAGAGTMVLELAAVRLLAPWFGTSSAVWTNVIGVVLMAMSLGYLAGSRLATRPRPMRSLGSCLLLAALFTLALPWCSTAVAELFQPGGMSLDRAAAMLTWGSLATSLILFGPPAAMLGCVGPLAVECVQVQAGGHAGTAGGRVLFASTLGSLLGTFGTTHFLIPVLGIGATLLLASSVLFALATLSLWMAKTLGVTPAAGLLVLAALLVGFSRRGTGPKLEHVLATAESPYQTIRVVETGSGGTLMRQLQVNEGFDSFQSVWFPEPGLLPMGYYYNYFCPPVWWSAPDSEWNLLVLGLGAGTTWRVMDATLPGDVVLRATGIEIDATVIELARAWMDLPPESQDRHVLAGWDARVGMNNLAGTFDQIVLDTYANQMEIPAHLCSVEFFGSVADKLSVGGWLSINIGGFGFDDPVVEAIAQTAAQAFGSPALVVRVPSSRNCVAYLRRDAALPEPGTPGWLNGAEELRSLLAPVELAGTWKFFDGSGDSILTDDLNSIDRKQHESIARRARELEALDSERRP